MDVPIRSNRNAWFLAAAIAVATWSCGEGPVRPEPPSPPPLTADTPAKAAPVATAVAEPATQAEPSPVVAVRSETAQEPAASSPPPAAAAAPEAAPPDPLQWMEDRAAREEAKKVRLAEAEQDVVDARARVAELEKRLLAVKNPFLPRPVLPPDEAQAWQGLNGPQRVERVEGQLVEARDAQAAAEKALAAAKAQ